MRANSTTPTCLSGTGTGPGATPHPTGLTEPISERMKRSRSGKIHLGVAEQTLQVRCTLGGRKAGRQAKRVEKEVEGDEKGFGIASSRPFLNPCAGLIHSFDVPTLTILVGTYTVVY